MKLEQALLTLQEAEPALRAKGVLHAGIFGSTARGEERPGSDVDILIDFDPAARITVYDYAAVKHTVATFFKQRVDVIDRRGLKPDLQQPVARDVVYAF